LRFIMVGFLVCGIGAYAHAQQSSGGIQNSVDQHRATFGQYCVACHNETLKTAGVMLDIADISDLGKDADLWERVLTKLSLRAMPPVGMPRPGEDQYEALTTYLRSNLDRLASENLNPGKPAIHRLNRTEYANAIRDLLNLQIDPSAYLPVDNVADGFDNIAEALSVSPLLMEQYMFAASQVSQLAIGSDSMTAVSETYEISDKFIQNARMSDDLPFGSRGGIAVWHYFPVDGEYTISARLLRNRDAYIYGLRKENMLDLRLDHKQVGSMKVGGEVHGRSGPIFTNNDIHDYAGDLDQVGYEFSADYNLDFRFPVKAGRRLVGVTFMDDQVKKTGYLTPEMTRYDRLRYKGGEPAIHRIVVTGPFNAKGKGDTPSRQKIFVCHPGSTASDEEEAACASSIVANLARRAYRRPVTDTEMESLIGLYRKGHSQDGFEKGVELALQGILTGPEFLFRIEQGPSGGTAAGVYPVSDIDLASRLSFFLWSTIPDDELLYQAEQKRLRDPDVLRQQVHRMLADPRSEALVNNFGEQWLRIRSLDFVEPQIDIFPVFDDELREAMKQELALWFKDMVREDRSVKELLDSDYTYVNERLARHYGIPDVYGSNFRRMALSNPERHGMFGKAGLLTVTSFNNRTSPVVRGQWVLENMLNMPPPPPPTDVPALEVASEGGKALTMKEAMEAHRHNPVCANCHKLMEPIGLALESYDAIGSHRTRYKEANNAEVDSSGLLFDGSKFDNTVEFQQVFQKHSERFVQTVTMKLLTYALGRGVEYYDQPVIRKIVRDAAEHDYTWSSIILGIIESTPFQYRQTGDS